MPRARQLMKTGREAYAKGDYEVAEAFYQQAAQARDMLTASERQDLEAQLNQNATALQSRREGLKLLKQAQEALALGKAADAESSLRLAQANQFLSAADRQNLASLSTGLTQLRKAQNELETKPDGKSLLVRGREALARGDLANAESLARQAEKSRSFMNSLAFWSDTPARLLDDVNKARAKAPKSPADDALPWNKKDAVAVGGVDAKAVTANSSPATDAERLKAKAQAKALVLEGYKALDNNDLAAAKKFANQARDLNAELEWFEPNPEKLIGAIQVRAQTNEVLAGNSNDPRALLRQGRSLLLQQRFDDAEKLAAQADSLNGRYSLFEDTPRKLKDEIVRARVQLDHDTAAKLTTDARRLVKSGNYPEARNLATQAKKLQGGSSGWMTWTDTPDAVLRDVARLDKNPSPSVPDATMAKLPQPALVSGQQNYAAKKQAASLVAEARALASQGHLAEARAKAVEADKISAVWAADEDSPAFVLRDLDTRASMRIKLLIDQASDTVAKNPTDPTRFQKADTYLLTARRLAESFRQDTTPIDLKIQWLAQVASQSRANPPVASRPVVQSAQAVQSRGSEEPSEVVAKGSPSQAKELLDQARREIKAGNTALARRFAEEAYPLDREEAQKVLRSIDSEENGQTIVTMQRNFQAGMDAYRVKDFRKAAGVLSVVDPRLLEPAQARQLGEVLQTPEMQLTRQPNLQPGLQPVAANDGGKENVGKSSISDLDDPYTSEHRRMLEIKYQKYLDLRRDAETKAMRLAKDNKEDSAIEELQSYLVTLKSSGLDNDHIDKLTRPIDDRLGKLRTESAKKEIVRQQEINKVKPHNEADYQAQRSKIDEEVVKLIKRSGEKYKEGKYDEALAEANKARDLDPNNVAANFAIKQTTIKINHEDWVRGKEQNEKEYLGMLAHTSGPVPTDKQPVRVDQAMADTLRKRNNNTIQQGIKSAKDLAIERKLSQPINLNFNDLPLYRVLQDLQILSGVNIVPDKAALEDKKISLEQTLSLNVDGISLKSALNLLLRQVRLTYVIKNEVIEITTPENAQGRRRVHTYSIADLVIPVEDKATSPVNSFEDALRRTINTNGGNAQYSNQTPYTGPHALQGGQPVSQGGSNGPAPTWTTTKQSASNTIEHLLMSLITNVIAPDTWSDNGGEGRIHYLPLGHALVISQNVEVQEEVAALLAALRRLQDLQISVEMRIVSVGEQFYERIGVNFDVNIRTPLSANQQNQLAVGIFNQAGDAGINRNLGVNGVVSGQVTQGLLTPDASVPIKATSYDFAVPPFGGFPGQLTGDGGIALGLAFLNDIQVFMFMEAAQGDRRTHIMQAPKITVFNGQTANINVQDVMFFLTGVNIIQQGSQTFFVPQNNPFPIGIGMTVTPVVSADRRFVRINLQPQLSNLISPNIPLIPVAIPIPQVFDGTNGAGNIAGQPVIFQMYFQQPAFTTIQINTTVNVPDGGTVLLGGMKTLAEGRNEFGPPILSQIPYLSRLFRNTAFGRDVSSIMILVTPRIIINEELEQEVLGNISIPR